MDDAESRIHATTTVLICNTYGGFGLSREAAERLASLGHEEAAAELATHGRWAEGLNDDGTPAKPNMVEALKHLAEDGQYLRDIPRADPLLLRVWRELGEKAGGRWCRLAAVEVPSDVKWHIDEYDGLEHVAEDHRSWYADD